MTDSEDQAFAPIIRASSGPVDGGLICESADLGRYALLHTRCGQRFSVRALSASVQRLGAEARVDVASAGPAMVTSPASCHSTTGGRSKEVVSAGL